MTTGYEVKMYNDISQIAKAVTSIAKSLEKIAARPTTCAEGGDCDQPGITCSNDNQGPGGTT